MANTIDFYLSQVAACNAEAERSTLVNVRDRNLRAAAAWQEMADKMLATEQNRAVNESKRAEAAASA